MDNKNTFLLLDLVEHPQHDSYQTAFNLLANLDVMINSFNKCLELNTNSNQELTFIEIATQIQTYFITANGLNEKIDTTAGFKKNEKISSESKGIQTIARIIRHKVAHEGIWIPTAARGFKKDVGSYRYFALSNEELKASLIKQSLLDREKLIKNQVKQLKKSLLQFSSSEELDSHLNQESEEINTWTNYAFELLKNRFENDYFDVIEFMRLHISRFIPEVIKIYSDMIIKKPFVEISKLRKEAKLKTIEERLEELNSVYNSICFKPSE